jgi:hypothetical protein
LSSTLSTIPSPLPDVTGITAVFDAVQRLAEADVEWRQYLPSDYRVAGMCPCTSTLLLSTLLVHCILDCYPGKKE